MEVMITRKKASTLKQADIMYMFNKTSKTDWWYLLTLASYSINFSYENSRKHGRGLH